jgi:hypothetical protein
MSVSLLSPGRVAACSAALALAALGTFAACTDLSSYSTTSTKQYAGCVVPASFVLAGVQPMTGLCLSLDANNLQTSPGWITSTDGRFQATPLRPVPQLWNDPLSTFNFGEGRTKNLLYMATPSPDAGGGADVTVVVSLMTSGDVEVRLLRGAPPQDMPDAAPAPSGPIFAVFPLRLRKDGCIQLRANGCGPDAQAP